MVDIGADVEDVLGRADIRRQDYRSSRPGRPPAGLDGARVADYPRISVRVPPAVRQTLCAVSGVRGQPQWRVLIAALRAYVDSLPSSEQRSIEELVRRSGT